MPINRRQEYMQIGQIKPRRTDNEITWKRKQTRAYISWNML